MIWLIPLLYMLSIGGICYVVLQAIHSGAEAYSGEYAEDTARDFEDLFLFIPPARIKQVAWGLSLAVFTLVFFLTGDLTPFGLTRGAIAGMLLGGPTLLVPRALLSLLRAQRLRRFNEQLVDALMNMSNALRAGFSITQAFEAVVKEGQNPISQEFSVFLQQTRVGVRFEESLTNLEQRVPSEDLSLMVRSIEVARLTGGNLTDVFDKIAETIRERLRIEGRIRSLTAQGRLQGIVVAMMPVVLLLAMFGIDPVMMRTFVTSPIGLMLLVIVAVLIIAGMLMIRKIVRIDV